MLLRIHIRSKLLLLLLLIHHIQYISSMLLNQAHKYTLQLRLVHLLQVVKVRHKSLRLLLHIVLLLILFFISPSLSFHAFLLIVFILVVLLLLLITLFWLLLLFRCVRTLLGLAVWLKINFFLVILLLLVFLGTHLLSLNYYKMLSHLVHEFKVGLFI